MAQPQHAKYSLSWFHPLNQQLKLARSFAPRTATMTKSLKLALFDCDGTLVDSQYAIVAAMNAAFLALGLPPPDPAAVRRVVGLPLVRAVALLLPDSVERLHAAVADRYRLAFADARNRGIHDEPLFPGMREALEAL